MTSRKLRKLFYICTATIWIMVDVIRPGQEAYQPPWVPPLIVILAFIAYEGAARNDA